MSKLNEYIRTYQFNANARLILSQAFLPKSRILSLSVNPDHLQFSETASSVIFGLHQRSLS